MKLKLVDHGMGYRMGDTIYINRELKKYPDLFNKVYNHELKHLNGVEHVDWNEPFDFQLFKFMVTHPSTWINLLPIWIIGNKIIYDKTKILLWLGIIGWLIIFVVLILWTL